jgi:hypothetical protein
VAHGVLAGLIIAEGEGKHDGKPENRADNYQLSALGTVAGVHEIEDDERSFEGGDNQRDHDIKLSEIVKGGPDGDGSSGHQREKDDKVNFRRDNVFGHAVLSQTLLLMPVNQI